MALTLLVAFLVQGTWALAGTTGGISGTVSDEKGAPVSGATVKIVSASQTAQTTTDTAGTFRFLSLQPDSYTISIEKKDYNPVSQAGLAIFADQQQTLSVRLTQAKEIARVTSRAASSLVKGGVGSDLYNVNASTITAVNGIGGGANQNSAYSAIASVPGAVVGQNGAGWNQSVYIRGSQSYFSGFEYDGIPVNRAFDNYNSSTESNLGLQELQVYTGGGPAGSSSAGVSGFVNQVIKTGTYPGYGNLEGGLGTPAFYHQGKVEAGGASPDRRFSYYVGVSGYGQDFRYLDQQNGAGLETPGQPYSGYLEGATFNFGNGGGRGVPYLCDASGAPPAAVAALPWNATDNVNYNGGTTPGCLGQIFGLSGFTSNITDRESIINLHFGIPHRHSTAVDDLQLLWSASSLHTSFFSSQNDQGINTFLVATTGAPYCSNNLQTTTGAPCAAPNYLTYHDIRVFNAPFGSNVASLTPTYYYSPSSPTNRAPGSALPLNAQDTSWNDTGVAKLQYTHQLSSSAFIRAFGYTYFSDWTNLGPNTAAVGENPYIQSPNYDLITHTAGAQLQLVDQVNAQNLISLTGNLTGASVVRFNNGYWSQVAEPIGLFSNNGGTYTCYNKTSGVVVPCYSRSFKSNADYVAANGAPPPIPAAAAAAGAKWQTLWDGNATGTYNTVRPLFSFATISDEFRPNDRLSLNLELRLESYKYNLANSNTPANQFYGQIVQNYACYNPATKQVATTPLPPGVPPPASPIFINGPCSSVPAYAGYVHPNGTTQGGIAAPLFSLNSPSSYSLNFASPRVSGTYTLSPDTVLRASLGRFTEPPISASVQYINKSGNATNLWANFLGLGFLSPFHNNTAQTATNADFSLERRIRGTQWSFKITPFYNDTQGYQQQSFIGAGFVTQIPVGEFRSTGLETAFTYGDFSRNGLSGQLALTFTNAKMRFQDEFGGAFPNEAKVVNQYIDAYNALANGSQCYTPAGSGVVNPGVGDPTSCANPTAIRNPYYGKPVTSGYMDPNGWFAPGGDALAAGVNTNPAFYDAPFNATIVLNYKHDKLTVTPTMQITAGSHYGTPLDFNGVDPRLCGQNSAAAGITAVSPSTNPQQCDYLSVTGQGAPPLGVLYVPNPQTGQFTSFGQYQNPTALSSSLAIAYDVSPRVAAKLTLTNLFHTCFGGTKTPWTSAYSPSSTVCGYGANGLYPVNFYNGTSPNDTAANGVAPSPFMLQSYAPSTGNGAGSGTPFPFNAYFSLNIKI